MWWWCGSHGLTEERERERPFSSPGESREDRAAELLEVTRKRASNGIRRFRGRNKREAKRLSSSVRRLRISLVIVDAYIHMANSKVPRSEEMVEAAKADVLSAHTFQSLAMMSHRGVVSRITSARRGGGDHHHHHLRHHHHALALALSLAL